MRRLFFVTACFLSLATQAQSVDDPYFRQAENLLRTFNPAFNGLEDFDKRSLLLNFRNRGFDLSKGAPLTFSGTYGGHFDKLHGGLDLSYMLDKAGSRKNNWFSVKYDAQFKLGEKLKLGLGLRTSFSFVDVDYGVCPPPPTPCVISGDKKGVLVPDFDAGLMLTSTDKFFLSASARHLTEPSLKTKNNAGDAVTMEKEYLTWYGMMGGSFERGEHLRITYAADYRQSGSSGHGEGRIEARWRFVHAGFYCVLDRWQHTVTTSTGSTVEAKYSNPYGFSFGFSRKEGRIHIISSFEPPFKTTGGTSSFETGMKYVFGRKN